MFNISMLTFGANSKEQKAAAAAAVVVAAMVGAAFPNIQIIVHFTKKKIPQPLSGLFPLWSLSLAP